MIEARDPVSRREFFNSYASDPAASGFTDFLLDRPVKTTDQTDFSNTHVASLKIFAAIQSNNQSLFSEIYADLSRRQLSPNAPWWMNDPLMYGLVLGAVKFGSDFSWLEQAIRLRIENSTGESVSVAETYLDILAENWGSELNLRPLILVTKYLLNENPSDTNLLNSVYREITETPFPYSESNFLNAVYIRAFDVAVLSKAPVNQEQLQALEDLANVAWDRARISSLITWWVVLIVLLILFVSLFLWVKGIGDGVAKEWLDTLAFLGIPTAAIIPVAPWIIKRRKIIDWLQRWEAKHYFKIDPNVLPQIKK